MIYTLNQVTKSYPTRHGLVSSLNGLTFDVRVGERVALIGPSGAGKTTLFRLLNATLRPTSGSICFDGQNVGGMSGRELRAMMPWLNPTQQTSQNPDAQVKVEVKN